MDAYLSSLPGGVSAYPECLAKGSLVRLLTSEAAYAGVCSRLSYPLRGLLEDLPIGSEWIPAVHYLALVHAVVDVSGQPVEEVLAGARERYRRMFESSTYRILMAGSTPVALVRGAPLRWANWHRGTTLEVEGIADDGVRLGLRYPRGLFDELLLGLVREAFLAALDVSQARSPRAELVETGEGLARFRVAWG